MTRLWGPTPPSVHPSLLFPSLPPFFLDSSPFLPFLAFLRLSISFLTSFSPLFLPLSFVNPTFLLPLLLFSLHTLSLASLLPPSLPPLPPPSFLSFFFLNSSLFLLFVLPSFCLSFISLPFLPYLPSSIISFPPFSFSPFF